MQRYQFDEKMMAYLESLRTPLAIYQFLDQRVVTLMLSDGFRDLFGFADKAEAYFVMDNDMYSTAHPDDAARVADAAYRFATQGGRYEVVYRVRLYKGQSYTVVHAIGEHVFTETGERLAYVWYTDEGPYTEEGAYSLKGGVSDATLRNAFSTALHKESMIQQNVFDTLTGMPNMTYFFTLAEAARPKMEAQGRQIAMLFIDLSGMKLFNSKYGFEEGDKLLRAFAAVLSRRFGNQNCGRLSQDHFAIYTDAENLEQRLQATFDEVAGINEGKTLPMRVGIYLVSDDCRDVAQACDKASYACDELKGSYGSVWKYFTETMLRDAENRRYIVENLDKALAQRWIRVYYQPIIRAANGKVCDEEALSRWIDPEKGLLSPAEFIPAIEDAKLIYKLDLYVVDEIIKKMKRQADAGLYVVPVSVNLSRYDFEAVDVVEEIRRRVDEAGVPREKLTIEITESVIGSSFEFMKEQVQRFRDLGFQVWMDDFGSGYSSLDVLQSIRFDLIKLDMRFMEQFDRSEDSRIILTELIKMAIGLGIDTVCEGVETVEQVEFLREVGCTKLQGFYFCKAISQDDLLRRYETGTQIGFENPRESEYYAAIGRINLYDMNAIAQGEQESFGHYFNTIPMAILESNGDSFTLVRCNNTYRGFMMKMFGVAMVGVPIDYSMGEGRKGNGFLQAMRRCGLEGNEMMIDEEMEDGSTAHAFIKRIAVNPVTGTAAIVAAVLSVMESKDQSVTYALVAKSLAANYFNLYYVDLDTEKFSEFSADPEHSDLSVERHGEDFFAASRKDAMQVIYEPDQEYVLRAFTKENMVRALDADGVFTLNYRLLLEGKPLYVAMKAVRMKPGDSHVIIGVSNVDAQMRQKQALERVRAEQETYARITALAGNYICIYTVDPVTEHYIEYSATADYEGLGLDKTGEDFFARSRAESERAVYPEDREMFQSLFTRENVMQAIERSGLFVLQYRLVMDGRPQYVNVKAALVKEKDGPQLIIGVNNVDAQVRREQEYDEQLRQIRSRATVDTVTGVKNRRAYDEAASELDRRIAAGEQAAFAIALFDVKGLREINETQGHQAGDQCLRTACAAICDAFKRSPVFRVVDDAFAVIAQGKDYDKLDELMAQIDKFDRAALAGGVARYDGAGTVADVFGRAEQDLRRRKQG